MAKKKSTAAKVLLDAAKYIEKHGWCQGIEMDAGGAVCATGAIWNACQDYNKGFLAQEALKDYLHYKTEESTILEWNDRENNRKDKVLTVMRNAAKYADSNFLRRK